MKKAVIIFFLLFISYTLSAQYRTILDDDFKFSGFGAYIINFTSLDREFAFLRGGGAALLIEHHFFIGGYKWSSRNDIIPSIKRYRQDGYRISYEESGLWVGGIFSPEESIHFTLSLFSGLGEINLKNPIYSGALSDKVYVIAPAAELEINLSVLFRIGVGLNYRFVAGVDKIEEYQNNNFSSPGAFVTLKLGWFRTN